jgi:hypothetical protein
MGFHQLADGAITRRLGKLAGAGTEGRPAFGKLPRTDFAEHRTGVRQDRNGLRYERRHDEDVKIEQQLRISLGISDADLSTMTWREYHESTQHSVESLRRTPHVLDWANMPDPFRHYEGVPVLDLPADPPNPEIPALEVLEGVSGATPVGDGPTFLSQLLFYSASISASKRAPSTGYRYALRVNPSSGNLHPTEFHFFTRGLKEWPDGLYHYLPSAHMAEQRALGVLEGKLAGSSAPIVFVLTSIAWREAWKYRDRA